MAVCAGGEARDLFNPTGGVKRGGREEGGGGLLGALKRLLSKQNLQRLAIVLVASAGSVGISKVSNGAAGSVERSLPESSTIAVYAGHEMPCLMTEG